MTTHASLFWSNSPIRLSAAFLFFILRNGFIYVASSNVKLRGERDSAVNSSERKTRPLE